MLKVFRIAPASVKTARLLDRTSEWKTSQISRDVNSVRKYAYLQANEIAENGGILTPATSTTGVTSNNFIASSCSLLTRYVRQLVATRLPNTNEGQYVNSVEKWVDLYNDFMVSGEVPEPDTYLELLIAMENEKYRTEWVKGFKVRHPCFNTGNVLHGGPDLQTCAPVIE